MLWVAKILVNMMDSPQIIDAPPLLSLVLHADKDGERCSKFAVRLTSDSGEKWIWTFSADECDSAYVRLPKDYVLHAHTRYAVSACVWTFLGECSEWSAEVFFETAFLSPAEWSARYISANLPDESCVRPCFVFCREFKVENELERACLHITAKGVYIAAINGVRVSQDVLTPGYMSYHHHLAYQSYDVSHLIRPGANRLEVLVGDGWYRGYLSSAQHRNYYGKKRELLCQLCMVDSAGQEMSVGSDEQFTWRFSPILLSEIYTGEICDQSGESGVDVCTNRPVIVGCGPEKERLHCSLFRPMHMETAILPERLIITPKGEKVLDFGQVMSGTVEITVSGPRGSWVVLQCSDTLDENGNFYCDNIELFSLKNQERPIMQRLAYRLAGEGREIYRPTFTYQCFRYVKIVSFPGEPKISDFRGIPITSFTQQTGFFRCGHDGVNQLFENVICTERATFMDVPIAGPQRAERFGWTGDNQLIAPTCCRTMFDTYSFFGKWLEDVRLDQFPNGQVGTMAPYVSFSNEEQSLANPSASAAWGDAAVIVPWIMYTFYGDKKFLERYRNLAKNYVEFMRRHGNDELSFSQEFSFGDWFALDNGEDAYSGRTDKLLFANFFYYRSVDLLSRILDQLGERAEAEEYIALAGRICRRLREEYFDQAGYLLEPTQTSCAMALEFGVAEKPTVVTDQLVSLIEDASVHLLTGFAGTSLVLQALCHNGKEKLAYDLLLQESYPSWLYAVRLGATTIWEHWNSVKVDGTLWSPNMNSFCHLTFGSVVEWMFSCVLGICQIDGDAGYKDFLVRPKVDRRLGYARGTFQTVRGQIGVSWQFHGTDLTVAVDIPVGTAATVVLPEVQTPDIYLKELSCLGITSEMCSIVDHEVTLRGLSGHHVFRYGTRV